MDGNPNIASERRRIGLNQEQFGARLGVSREAVSRWERGEWEPSDARLLEMAALFGCSVDYLLGRTDERLPATK